ncbi:hypothetical protein Afil01_24980 [Actinorhabdospora filicis]|uniref:Pyrrolo-quinoline quinone repeat domain-containing protein n=1 Tax=Actinorhabdospora filicis TaxID=1785913 RepID=A0A9W6W9M4_9ACTN|nr:PQQ-binding-like beta-propeller repeat protein [Actinorhabdospora filicis]GLZ77691.1 hypothetical protein Afil01_24980 [Actinorhabdospora filicis]
MHIDLDVAAPEEEPRRRSLPAALTAIVLLAASIAIYVMTRPAPTALIVEPQPVWAADTGLELGAPVHAEARGSTVLVTTKRGVFGFDRATGERRWQVRLSADELLSSPEAAARGVRVTGERVLIGRTGRTDVLDLVTGVVRYQLPPGETFVGSRVVTKMTCAPGGGCELAGYGLSDGVRAWRVDLPGAVVNAVPDVVDTGRQSRADVGENLYPPVPLVPERTWAVFTQGASTRVVDLADGHVWSWTGPATAQYAVLGERLLDVTDKSAVRGVDPTTGVRLWRAALLDPTWTTPVLADGLLLDAPLYKAPGPAEFQLVDPASGAVEKVIVAADTAMPALGVGGGTVVRLDAREPALQATRASGPAWTAHLGRGELGLVKWVTGDGRFVLDAMLGDVHRVWIVDLATGAAGGFGGHGGVVGYSDGGLITSSYLSMSGSFGVEFYELARR